MSEIWVFRADIVDGTADVVGYEVEARDGRIGKIDEHSVDVGSSYIVVDTGFWIFGKKRLIPAGVVERVDQENETVYVGLSKDEIKAAPDYDEQRTARDDDWDAEPYADYYGGFSARP